MILYYYNFDRFSNNAVIQYDTLLISYQILQRKYAGFRASQYDTLLLSHTANKSTYSITQPSQTSPNFSADLYQSPLTKQHNKTITAMARYKQSAL